MAACRRTGPVAAGMVRLIMVCQKLAVRPAPKPGSVKRANVMIRAWVGLNACQLQGQNAEEDIRKALNDSQGHNRGLQP